VFQNLAFLAARKSPRIKDRKWVNISNMNPFAIFDPRGFGALEMPTFESRPVYSNSSKGNAMELKNEAKNNLKTFKNKVILIEDDHDLIQMITFMLESHGIQLITFDNGSKALKYFNEHEFAPPMPLIILDRILPDMDGIEILKFLKSHYSYHVPVLMLSSLSSQKDIFDGYEGGSIDYVTKPFDRTLLLRKIVVLLSEMRL